MSWRFAGTSAPALDKYEALRQEAERAMRRQEHHKKQQQGTDDEMQADAAAGGTSRSPSSPTHDTETSYKSHTDVSGGGGKPAACEAAAGAEEGVKETQAAGAALAETAAPGAGKRRTDQAGVQSAKERYLARKLQKTS